MTKLFRHTLRGFTRVTDPEVRARLPKEARANVLQCDLVARNITDFGSMVPRGHGKAGAPFIELFFDGTPLRLARWPNDGFLLTGEVLKPPAGTIGGTFAYEGDQPARWLTANDAWMWGTWCYHWADATTAIARIDPVNRRIIAQHLTPYGIRKDQRYYVYNLLEELDEPGEWYLDRTRGVLYVYPPSNPDDSIVELSMLAAPFVEMKEVSHVILEGLVFETARWNGIELSGGERCLVAGCTIRRVGGTGIVVRGGTNHGIFGCDIYTMGRGGTVVVGGDRRTLTPGGHFVENRHIHDFSRIDRTYTPAVQMDGCGNRIAHDLFHDSPHHAIRVEGNDHLIEFNEVHSVVYESDDQGGYDAWFNPTYRGNVIWYNYWHHIGSGLDVAGQAGVRLDDAISGTLVYGNVFYWCSAGDFGGVQIHGGKENIVDNNVFAFCKYAVSFSSWGQERWEKFLASEGVVRLLTEFVDISKPPYSTKYPSLARLREGADINHVWRNVVYRCRGFLHRDHGQNEQLYNLITHSGVGFNNPGKGDFTVRKPTAKLQSIGFRAIPFRQIGCYRSALRASWPIVHSVTPRYHAETNGGRAVE